MSAAVAEFCSCVLEGPTYGRFLPHCCDRADEGGGVVEDVRIKTEDSATTVKASRLPVLPLFFFMLLPLEFFEP